MASAFCLFLEALVPFGDQSVDALVGRPDLKRSEADARVLRHQFDGMVHVLGFEHEESAQHFLSFGEGTISDNHLPIRPPQRLGSTGALQRLAGSNPMTAFVEHLVKGETLLYHVGLLFRRHGLPSFLVGVSEAYESHDVLRIVMTVSLFLSPARSYPRRTVGNVPRPVVVLPVAEWRNQNPIGGISGRT